MSGVSAGGAGTNPSRVTLGPHSRIPAGMFCFQAGSPSAGGHEESPPSPGCVPLEALPAEPPLPRDAPGAAPCQPLPLSAPLSAPVLGRAAVQPGGLAADEREPVELGGDEGGVGDVAVQGDAERHQVRRDPHLAAVGRVHEGEEEDAAHEEGHQDQDPVHFVQERVLHFELGRKEVNVG